MIRVPDHFAELRTLIDALCEESISAEEMTRLEDLLRNNPEAQEFYVHSMSIHAKLMQEFAGVAEWMTDTVPKSDVDARPAIVHHMRWSWRSRWLTAVACVAAACIAVVLVDATGSDLRRGTIIKVGMPDNAPQSPGPPAEMHRPMMRHRQEMENRRENHSPG